MKHISLPSFFMLLCLASATPTAMAQDVQNNHQERIYENTYEQDAQEYDERSEEGEGETQERIGALDEPTRTMNPQDDEPYEASVVDAERPSLPHDSYDGFPSLNDNSSSYEGGVINNERPEQRFGIGPQYAKPYEISAEENRAVDRRTERMKSEARQRDAELEALKNQTNADYRPPTMGDVLGHRQNLVTDISNDFFDVNAYYKKKRDIEQGIADRKEDAEQKKYGAAIFSSFNPLMSTLKSYKYKDEEGFDSRKYIRDRNIDVEELSSNDYAKIINSRSKEEIFDRLESARMTNEANFQLAQGSSLESILYLIIAVLSNPVYALMMGGAVVAFLLMAVAVWKETKESLNAKSKHPFGLGPLYGTAEDHDGRTKFVLWTVGVAMTLALFPLPYGYYSVMRWVVGGACAWLAIETHRSSNKEWAWVWGILSGIYNPIFPVHSNREIWAVVNILTIGITGWYGYKVLQHNKLKKEHGPLLQNE